MLAQSDYARKLDAALDTVGNDLGALERLNAALALMPDYEDDVQVITDPVTGEWDENPEWDAIVTLGAPSCREETFDDASGFEPTESDWDDYCLYLDRLDAERDYPEIESPRWTAWLQWLRTPAELPAEDFEPIPF